MLEAGSGESCEIAEECSFFERNEGLSNTIRTVREIFCTGQKKHNCARYVVYQQLGADKVPADLLPFDHRSADLLVEVEKKVPA
jgi:hypothetical protein